MRNIHGLNFLPCFNSNRFYTKRGNKKSVAFYKSCNCNFRSAGETLTRKQFKKRVQAVINFLTPPYKPYELASELVTDNDPIYTELAIRERSNRVGIVSVTT